MEKKDLQSGDWVELRNGDRCLVIQNCKGLNKIQDFCLIENNDFNVSDFYLNNLKNNSVKDYDIVKVWRNPYGMSIGTLNGGFIDDDTLIWERETPKKMTVEQISKELGYEVEIIK